MWIDSLKKWFVYSYIRRSGFFDPVYYLQTYPEVRRDGINPLVHYMNFGWREGKNPSEKFNTKYYLKMNPDVRRSGFNPLDHYLKHGRMEGRIPLPGETSLPGSQANKIGIIDALLVLPYKAGKILFGWIPLRIRPRILALFHILLGPKFDSLMNRMRSVNYKSNPVIQGVSAIKLIDLDVIQPAVNAGGSIAIHIHIFYHDLIEKFKHYLHNMPFPYDLYISVSNEDDLVAYHQAFSSLPFCKTVKIKRVPNRGRDIAPLFCEFGDELSGYTYIAHLHSKKSAYNKGATEGWFDYLCENLLGSQDRIRRNIDLLQGEQPYGIVYPQNYSSLPYWANTWLANKSMGQAWCARLGIRVIPRGYFDFPASSMFWARVDALAPLFKAGITLKDFQEESGQTDGTLSHCIERLLVICSLKQGMEPGIVKDKVHPSWSAWRFDQYINRSLEQMSEMISSPRIKLIAFDIFETLVCRPMLDPETIKKIVSIRVGDTAGHLYEKYRAIAEQQAREVKGFDAGMDEIYSHLHGLSGISKEALGEMRKLEEEVELAGLEPRQEGIDLYQKALTTGKPVALISDMFLPQPVIEKCLKKFKISGWDAFFLSNAIGLRKDTGSLYEHVLAHYGIKPADMLMVGDNERSDVQIPCDMGASFLHLMKPGDLAQGIPRFSNIILKHEHQPDLQAELTLGLVVRKNFSQIHSQKFDPGSLIKPEPYYWGYCLVGPLLVSFAGWLLNISRADGVRRLYFLSREGKIMQRVFDEWAKSEQNPPKSDYLVLSRRAASVAAITSPDDILEIAKTPFYTNTIENFLHTRYGLTLSTGRWREIASSLGYQRTTRISVVGREIKNLLPLLQLLETEIKDRADTEKAALLRYLTDKGLTENGRQAVVDIGYGGSIQGFLNVLLPGKVHGYYMMTDERVLDVSVTHGVTSRACFTENIKRSETQPVMLKYSFLIEKLLSSDDPQIQYYERDPAGILHDHYYNLTDEEVGSSKIRNSLQQGALDYTKDARHIRASLFPGFQPSCQVSQMLMDAFLTEQSQQEIRLLSKIVMDDHYCGLGLDT